MKINTIAKKGIVLMVLFAIISCGGTNSSGNKPNEQEKKEVKASQEEVSSKKEVKSYEEELKERMDPIEAKLNKTIESGENMLEASIELSEKWKEEYEKIYNLVLSKISDSEKPKFEAEEQEWFKNEEEKIKKELLSTDGMEEGPRDYEMLFASGKADLAKKRAMELAKNTMS